MFDKVLNILEAETDDILELAKIAGGDPKTFFIGANFMHIKVKPSCLGGFELYKAKFHHAFAPVDSDPNLFDQLNDFELRYLTGLASGKSQSEMAEELGRRVKHLEQALLQIRRKISGADTFEMPMMSKNELLYYAGLHHITECSDQIPNDNSPTFFDQLNDFELRYLAGLASGKSQSKIADELNRSTKYLEQVMLKIRRKVSGVSDSDKPTVNRNQLLYYAGLVNIIKHADSP